MTGAIIYRILRVVKASGNRPKRLHNTARILAESGILYTSITVVNLIILILQLNVHYLGLAVADVVTNAVVCHPRSFPATHDLRFRAILWLVSLSTSF